MNKLRSKRGESITEALAAVVVAALGSLLVAGSVMAAGRTMTKSDARMSVYYGQMNALAVATPTAPGEAYVKEKNSNKSFTAYSNGINVNVYSNTTDGTTISIYNEAK